MPRMYYLSMAMKYNVARPRRVRFYVPSKIRPVKASCIAKNLEMFLSTLHISLCIYFVVVIISLFPSLNLLKYALNVRSSLHIMFVDLAYR